MFNGEKINEICNSKKFTNFWELFDFLKITGHDEIESLILSSKHFNGKIWDNVLLAKTHYSETNIELFKIILTVNKVESHIEPLLNAYLISEKYECIEEFNNLIKSIEFTLDTQLGIELFRSAPNLQRDYDRNDIYAPEVDHRDGIERLMNACRFDVDEITLPLRSNNFNNNTDDLDDDVRI